MRGTVVKFSAESEHLFVLGVSRYTEGYLSERLVQKVNCRTNIFYKIIETLLMKLFFLYRSPPLGLNWLTVVCLWLGVNDTSSLVWTRQRWCVIGLVSGVNYNRFFKNPNSDGYINWHCHAARSNIWPPRRPIREREDSRHSAAIVASFAPSIRKSLKRWGLLKNCLVCRLLAGGVPRQGVVVEGVKGVKYAPMPPKIYKNRKKQAVSCTFWLINCQKCRFSLKITQQDILPRCFLRNTSILKFFIA